jgi:hypothetical protein
MTFNFDFDKYNFWDIYDCIKKYYPIGIPKPEEHNQFYFSYSGLKDLSKIIYDNIHVESNFKKEWEKLNLQIETETRKSIINTTYGQVPCFSSLIELQKVTLDKLTRVKQLHIFVSLIGPFYTIIGEDSNIIKTSNSFFRTTNFLTVSPQDEYSESFFLVADLIESKFKDYRFVPFAILEQKIEGLAIRYNDEPSNAIFNALFLPIVDLNARTFGNVAFRSEDWIKVDYRPVAN